MIFLMKTIMMRMTDFEFAFVCRIPDSSSNETFYNNEIIFNPYPLFTFDFGRISDSIFTFEVVFLLVVKEVVEWEPRVIILRTWLHKPCEFEKTRLNFDLMLFSYLPRSLYVRITIIHDKIRMLHALYMIHPQTVLANIISQR